MPFARAGGRGKVRQCDVVNNRVGKIPAGKSDSVRARFAGGRAPYYAAVKINEYLDAVKAALACRTDTELAQRLRVLQSRISNYRTGRTLPNLAMARLIAAALDMRTGTIVADIRNERAMRLRLTADVSGS